MEMKEFQALALLLVVLLKTAAENNRESDYKRCEYSKQKIFERGKKLKFTVKIYPLNLLHQTLGFDHLLLFCILL